MLEKKFNLDDMINEYKNKIEVKEFSIMKNSIKIISWNVNGIRAVIKKVFMIS